MRVLVAQPELSYEEVGRRLGMPVGSIGPTRARSLVTACAATTGCGRCRRPVL